MSTPYPDLPSFEHPATYRLVRRLLYTCFDMELQMTLGRAVDALLKFSRKHGDALSAPDRQLIRAYLEAAQGLTNLSTTEEIALGRLDGTHKARPDTDHAGAIQP